MAQNLGFLNFGIDGDDKALKAKLEALKKDAVSIEQIFKNIKLDTGGSKLSTDVQKAQLAADKLAISNEKVVASIHKTQKAEEDLNNSRLKGIEISNRSALSVVKEATEKAKANQIEVRTLLDRQKSQEQSLINEARLEGIRKRNELIGQSGQKGFKKSIDDANKSLEKQSGLLTSLEKKLVGAFSGYQLARFAKEIVNIRGEFQGLELAFTTMLGSAEQSRKMMSEITSLALETPYTVSEVANNTKQLIAMGIEADKVMATMKALGDVSAGLSVPMWRIAINYGQVSALGRLQAREIRDFAMAGVPIVEELAKQLGKTTSEITDMVSAGKIGFPEVEKAFQNMAGAGGKFHNMMEKQNSTVKGQMNRLEDQVQLMMNAIGKSNEGVIYGAIDAASNLVENYEKVGKVILSLVATYGAYKVALYYATQAQIGYNLSQATGYKWALLAEKATKALSSTMLANPYVAATIAVIGLSTAIWALHDSTTAQEKAQKMLNSITDEYKNTRSDLEKTNSTLVDIVNSETKSLFSQVEAFGELKAVYPELLADMDLHSFKALGVTEQQRLLNRTLDELDTKKSSDKIKEYEDILADLSNKYRDATNEGQEFTQKVDKLAGFDGFFRLHSVEEVRVSLTEILNQLKEQEQEKRKIREESEFLAKSEKERESILKGQLNELEFQKSSISAQIEEIRKVRGEWGKFDPMFNILNNQLNDVLSKIVETRSKLETNPDVKNKSYWEKQKKDAEDAIGMMDVAERGSKEWLKQLKLINEASSKLEAWNLSGKQKRTQKDPALTKLEKQIDLLKTARQEYEKLSKLMGGDSAFTELRKNSAFERISQSDLTNEGYIKAIKDMIAKVSALKQNDDTRKVLANLFSLEHDVVEKVFKENEQLITKELEKYKGKYDLYEQLRGITNNDEQAKKLIFGDAEGVVESYRDALIRAIDKTDNNELKKKLQEQLSSFDMAEKESFLKDMGKMLSQYQTTEDKITKIKSDGARERERIVQSDTSIELQEKLIEASLKKEQEQIDKLQSESLKLSPFYQKLFGDISNYGNRMLDSIISKTQSILDLAKDAKPDSNGKRTVEVDGAKYVLSDEDIARMTRQVARLRKEMAKNNPFALLASSYKNLLSVWRSGASTEDDKTDAISELGMAIKQSSDLVKSLSNDFANMFDVLGNENLADTTALIGDLTSSLGNIASGIMTNNPIGVIQGVISGITSIANFHDKKLDKQIRDSQLEVKKLQNAYKDLEFQINKAFDGKRFERQGELISNLYKQQLELERQLQAEQKKKSKDRSAIEDYKDQIKEIEREVHSIMQSIKDEVYGSVQENASNLGNALINAFKQGENAAIAWGDTVDDIITNIIKNVVATKYIEPKVADALKNYHDKTTGATDAQREQIAKEIKDTQALVEAINDLPKYIKKLEVNGTKMTRDEAVAYFEAEKKRREEILKSMNDPSLNKKALDELKDELNKIPTELEWVRELFDSLNPAKDSAKNTLSKGIKEITEDTANLLASYINAIRADVAINREQIMQLVRLSQINQQSLGQMLAQIMLIQVNTFNTANNTLRSAEIAEKTFNLLNSATIQGGGTRFNID